MVTLGGGLQMLAKQVGTLLVARRWRLAVAESATGGLIGHLITQVSGSSQYFWGGIIAYAMGSVRPERHRKLARKIGWRCGLKGGWRLLTGRYNKATRKFVRWILFEAGKEEPHSLSDAAHMHWNMLPEARGTEIGKCFLETFVRHARAHGMKKMYGHMTIPPGKRSTRIFERMGWEEIDRKEQTKFRDYTDGKVYTITLFRQLDEPTGRGKTGD